MAAESQRAVTFLFRDTLWFMANICWCQTALRQVVEAVNLELAKKTKLRDISKMLGGSPSKSAIHTHAKRCVSRAILKEYAQLNAPSRNGRMIVQWPDGTAARWQKRQLPPPI